MRARIECNLYHFQTTFYCVRPRIFLHFVWRCCCCCIVTHFTVTLHWWDFYHHDFLHLLLLFVFPLWCFFVCWQMTWFPAQQTTKIQTSAFDHVRVLQRCCCWYCCHRMTKWNEKVFLMRFSHVLLEWDNMPQILSNQCLLAMEIHTHTFYFCCFTNYVSIHCVAKQSKDNKDQWIHKI